MIVQEADRLGRLVDNLLMASGLETGVRQYRRARVSLSAAVRAALRRLDLLLASEGFTVSEAIDDQPLDVEADPDALEQVVLNLVGNAVKYSAATRQITVRVHRSGGHGIVEVADSGIGIEQADLGRIFDRFYRTHAAATHATGAGLGLTLVRHFTDAHGGRVAVASTVGVGTVVALTLPLAVD